MVAAIRMERSGGGERHEGKRVLSRAIEVLQGNEDREALGLTYFTLVNSPYFHSAIDFIERQEIREAKQAQDLAELHPDVVKWVQELTPFEMKDGTLCVALVQMAECIDRELYNERSRLIQLRANQLEGVRSIDADELTDGSSVKGRQQFYLIDDAYRIIQKCYESKFVDFSKPKKEMASRIAPPLTVLQLLLYGTDVRTIIGVLIHSLKESAQANDLKKIVVSLLRAEQTGQLDESILPFLQLEIKDLVDAKTVKLLKTLTEVPIPREDDVLPSEAVMNELFKTVNAVEKRQADFLRIHQVKNYTGDPEEVYMQSTAVHTLLTHEEVIELSQVIEAKRAMTANLGQFSTLEDINQGQQIIESEAKARQLLIACNSRLVISVATSVLRKKNLSRIILTDLFQEGQIGLMRGIDKYQWRKGNHFSTYMVWWISQEITRSLIKKERTIYIPVHANEDLIDIRQHIRAYRTTHGVDPTLAELSEVSGMAEEKIMALLRADQIPQSLDYESGEVEGTSLGDTIADPEAESPQFAAEKLDLLEKLTTILSDLSEREREIITRRYGLVTGESETLAVIGNDFGVTKEAIRLVEKKALKRMRAAGDDEDLAQFLKS
jgi:RNA polymerase primary sigma factor